MRDGREGGSSPHAPHLFQGGLSELQPTGLPHPLPFSSLAAALVPLLLALNTCNIWSREQAGKTKQEEYRNCTSVLYGRPQSGTPSPSVPSPGLAALLGQWGSHAGALTFALLQSASRPDGSWGR